MRKKLPGRGIASRLVSIFFSARVTLRLSSRFVGQVRDDVVLDTELSYSFTLRRSLIMKSRIKPDSMSLIIIALVATASSFLVHYLHYIPLMPHSVLIHALIVGLLSGAGAVMVLRMQERRMQRQE